MKKNLLTILVFALTASGLENDMNLKHALGWDDGISYRYKITDKYFIGLSVTGGLSKSIQNLNEQRNFDSIGLRSYTQIDSSLYYNANVNLKIGREIIKEKFLGVNVFFSPYVNYYKRTQNPPNVDDYYLVGGKFGFEPTFKILKRFSFGSKFGLDAYYQKRNSEYKRFNNQNSEIGYEYEHEAKNYGFDIFGTNFSTNLRLFGYYEF